MIATQPTRPLCPKPGGKARAKYTNSVNTDIRKTFEKFARLAKMKERANGHS